MGFMPGIFAGENGLTGFSDIGSLFGVYPAPDPFVGVLDGLTASPYLAYSTRRLSSAYAGDCMRVRNTITTTVYEIPFSSDGWADFSALNQAHLHEVQIWYDQSGNSRNGIQLGGNGLPVLGFNILNSRPVIRFYSTSVRYLNLGNLSALTAGDMFYVARVGADPAVSGGGRSWALGTSGNTEHITFSDGNVYDDFGSTSRAGAGNPTTALTSWHLWNDWSAVNDRGILINEEALYSTATNTVGFPASCYLNGNADGRDAAEFILFAEKIGGTDRTTLRTDANAAFTLF